MRTWGTRPTTATQEDTSGQWDQLDAEGDFFTGELLDLLAKGLRNRTFCPNGTW